MDEKKLETIGNMDISADEVLDVRGLLCPMPTVKTKLKLEKIGVGQILEVIATDPATKEDMPAWCDATGNEFIMFRVDGDEIHLFIRKLLDEF